MIDRMRELAAELERVRAERDAMKSTLEHVHRYVTAVERAPTGVMCVSGEKGRYVFANQAFARMVGRPLHELLTCDPYEIWLQVTHPDDLPSEREGLERIARGEIDGYRFEKRLIPRDGDTRWYRVDIHATREPNGRLESITGFFTDVDELRTATAARDRMETQLRQAQKMDALGKLAGGVAH